MQYLPVALPAKESSMLQSWFSCGTRWPGTGRLGSGVERVMEILHVPLSSNAGGVPDSVSSAVGLRTDNYKNPF